MQNPAEEPFPLGDLGDIALPVTWVRGIHCIVAIPSEYLNLTGQEEEQGWVNQNQPVHQLVCIETLLWKLGT